jgi:hypothetical protein
LNPYSLSRSMPYVEYDEVEAVCAECGRIFRSEEALEAHRRESHATLPPVAPEAPVPEKKRRPPT